MYISGWILGYLTWIPFGFIGLYVLIRFFVKEKFSMIIGCLVMLMLWIGASLAVLMIPYETCTGFVVFPDLYWTIVSIFTTPRFVIFGVPSIVLLGDLVREIIRYRRI